MNEALNAYFAEHQEEFRTPEMVSLQYLRFAPDRYAAEVTFDEAELQKYYQRHLDLFEIAEQVKAAHILIKVAQDAGAEMKEKKRKQATEILEKARAGEDFAQLAKKYSDDPGSASRGGELGFFPRGAMVAPFENAAFALPPGQISDLVESPYGYHIIKVEEHVEPGVKPFAEVVEEVKAGLRAEKAQRLAYEKAMDAYNLNRKEGSLAKAAEANDLKVEETGLFDRQGSAEGLGDAPEIVSTAFTLEPGALARPLSLPQGAILFAVKERQESRRPELAEVRDAVETAFRSEKGRELAQQAAEAAVAEQKTDKKLADLARQGRQKVEETGLFSRAYGSFVPGIGNSEELANAAFSLTEAAPAADRFFEEGGSFVVIQLKNREKADMSALDQTQRDQLREALLSKQKSQAIEQQLDQLRSQAEISISPNIASSLQGKNS